jgi:hypothetical protein
MKLNITIILLTVCEKQKYGLGLGAFAASELDKDFSGYQTR